METNSKIIAGGIGLGLLGLGGYALYNASGKNVNRVKIYPALTWDWSDKNNTYSNPFELALTDPVALRMLSYNEDYTHTKNAYIEITGLDILGNEKFIEHIDLYDSPDYLKQIPDNIPISFFKNTGYCKPIVMDLGISITHLKIKIFVDIGDRWINSPDTITSERIFEVSDMIYTNPVNMNKEPADTISKTDNRTFTIDLLYDGLPLSEYLQNTDDFIAIMYLNHFIRLNPHNIVGSGVFMSKPDILKIYGDTIELPIPSGFTSLSEFMYQIPLHTLHVPSTSNGYLWDEWKVWFKFFTNFPELKPNPTLYITTDDEGNLHATADVYKDANIYAGSPSVAKSIFRDATPTNIL